MEFKQVFLRGKKNEETCEDGYVFCENYAAVVDGVTSKSDRLFWGKTPGRISMEILCREIPLLGGALSVEQAVGNLSGVLRRERERMNGDHPVALPKYPRACAAIYSKARREIWLIGDCQCMVNGKLYTNTKKIDDVMAQLRSFVLEGELLAGKTEEELIRNDPGRQAILPYLKQQLQFENRAGLFGYPVLNGETVLREQLVVIPVPEGSLVTLATDGYPVLRESLAESEAALGDLLSRDPFCCRENMQTKGMQSGNVSFDDRCFLQFTT